MRRALFLALVSVAFVSFADEPQAPADAAPAPSAEAQQQAIEASGPNEMLTHFFDYARSGDFDKAAQYLTLDFLPAGEREAEGERLARRLMFLLDQYVIVDSAELARQSTATRVRVGELPLGRLKIPVEIVERGDDWRFSARTVRSIDPLFAQHGSTLWEKLPPWLVARSVWVLGRWQWIGLLLMLTLGLFIARAATAILTPIFKKLTSFTKSNIDDRLVTALEKPFRFFLFIVLLAIGIRVLSFPLEAQGPFDDILRSAGIAVGVWLLFALSGVVSGEIVDRAQRADDFSSRGVRTQVTVLHRVANAVILVVGGALVLLQFPGVRSIGMSMLASAGVAGVVIGLAAQRSIGNLLAGIQLSFTQPMRIGDTVIVENEWGWIEEITLTYVIVKIWDLRRLVVPISYFLEKPFQNWTRSSSEILGTVYLYADYKIDVEALRAELVKILEPERGKLWNGKAQGVQVTDATDRSVQIRALMSSDDAGKSWDLRCLVREKLLTFLKANQPQALPRVRAEGWNHENGNGHDPKGPEFAAVTTRAH